MFCRLPIHPGFLGYIGPGLFLVVFGKPWLQVAFPALTPVDEGNRIFKLPRLSRPDGSVASTLASAVVPEKNTQLHSGRDGAVGGLANPFWEGAGHSLISARLVAFSLCHISLFKMRLMLL